MEMSDLEITVDISCVLFTRKAKPFTMIVMKAANLHLWKSGFCSRKSCGCLL